MKDIRIRHLRYVIALSEELNFSRAAMRLHISQSLLSRELREIEQQLGITLFQRTRKEVSLTLAGQKFVHGARKALLELESAKRSAKRPDGAELDPLVVGSVACEASFLVDTIREFSTQFQHVRLELRSLSPDQLLTALREGLIDAGFVMLPIHQHEMSVEKLGGQPRLLAVPVHHPFAGRRRIPLTGLEGEPLILLARSYGPEVYDQVIQKCLAAGFVPNIRYEVTNIMTGLLLVEAGLGLSLVPRDFQAVAGRGVVFRELIPPLSNIEYAAAYRADRKSATLASFISAAKAKLAESAQHRRLNKARALK